MKDCSIVSISDIHLGHRKNDTFEILRCLRKELIESGILAQTDILIIAGDLFDRLLDLENEYIPGIQLLMAALLNACERFDVILLVVEGTPSHDRGQSHMFETMAKAMKSTCELHYVTQLDILYLERYDAQILFVPDVWRPTAQETLSEFKELLKAKGLEQVDLAIMHGQFEYQLPPHVKSVALHSSEEYQKLVKVHIFIGHDHTHSRFGKITSQGSFDRLVHGEEEPKGFVKADIRNDKATIWFIENKDARIYKTVDCTGLSMEETVQALEAVVKTLRMDSCVRIKAESNHPVFSHMAELSKISATIEWSKKQDSEEIEKPQVNVSGLTEMDEWAPIHIDANNITKIVMDRLKMKTITPEQLDFIHNQLEELK